MYDVIKGPNGSIIIDILVPGHGKEDLECSFEEGYLTVKSLLSPLLGDFRHKGIKEFKDITLSLGESIKIDLLTLNHGILRVLCSKIISPAGTKLVIQ